MSSQETSLAKVIYKDKELELADWVSLAEAAACIKGKTPPLSDRFKALSSAAELLKENLEHEHGEIYYHYVKENIVFWGFRSNGSWLYSEHGKAFKFDNRHSDKLEQAPANYNFEDFNWTNSWVAPPRGIEVGNDGTAVDLHGEAYTCLRIRTRDLLKQFNLSVDAYQQHEALYKPKYTTPYLSVMNEAIEHFNITKDNQPKVTEHLIPWLEQRIKEVTGEKNTNNKAKMMATFVRLPESQKGGNRPHAKPLQD